MKTTYNLSSTEFIKKVFIEGIGKLVDDGSYHFAFLSMSQAIETLGSFLDAKPLKARDQSKLRFSHAINKLMPFKYADLNNHHELYNQLRASLAHTFTPGRRLILTSKANRENGSRHLQIKDEQLILVAEDFYQDFKKACLRLLEGMDQGIIHEKKKNTAFYYTFD